MNSSSTLSLVRPTPGAATAPSRRVIIVSNRLPWTASADGSRLHRSSGGLATGLARIHERSKGLWIGWSGLSAAASPEARRAMERQLRDVGAVAVVLDEAEIAGFYRRFSNEALWPVLHGGEPAAGADDWATYQAVNRRYADAVAAHLRPGDRVWVHDYHLMLVPGMLRQRCPDVHVGFFLHTPFPDAGVFARLPWRAALLEGLLGADVIGFHTRDYQRRFLAAVQATLAHATTAGEVLVGERTVSAFACPMGVDTAMWEAEARRPDVVAAAAHIARSVGGPLFVGVDRLDYTKGIPQRLLAFERLLRLRPELRGRARLVQLAVPSREDVGGYRQLREEAEAIVARVNRELARPGWVPIEYLYGSVDVPTLVALYRAADVMLVTPLCDGMNLVAKEFVASRVDEGGVLVLSEHAGAAVELRAALRVEPRDVDALALAYEAAIGMSPAERRVRMRRLRLAVRSNSVFDWAARFLDAMPAAAPIASVARE